MTDENTFDPDASAPDFRRKAFSHAASAEALLNRIQTGSDMLNAQLSAQRAQAHAELAGFWLGAAMDDDARRPLYSDVQYPSGDPSTVARILEERRLDGMI